jgi:hypothetical protein
MKLMYVGRIQEGKLLITNRRKFSRELKEAFEGKRVRLTIEKIKKKRSSQQNRYLWGCVYEIAQEAFSEQGHIGVTKDEVHEFLKNRFLSNGKEVASRETGEVIKMGSTTTTLSTVEFMDYVTQIQQFFSEFFNVNIPDPHEQLTLV